MKLNKNKKNNIIYLILILITLGLVFSIIYILYKKKEKFEIKNDACRETNNFWK